VDTAARDLACPELWQQSLERSLARRGRPTRSSLELFHLQPERDLSRGDLLRESLQYSQLRRSAVARRPVMSLPSAGGISALALLAATTVPGLLSGRGPRAGGERIAFRADTGQARPADALIAASSVKPSLRSATSPAISGGAGTLNGASHGAAATASASAASAAPTSTSAASFAATSASLHSPPKHLALAHDATASGGASGGAAHALSGGAAPPATNTSTAASRVPGIPQPAGHPSTGGGAVEDAARTTGGAPQAAGAPARPRTPTHSVAAVHKVAPAHAVTPSHPALPSHPVTKTHPATTTHPTTVTHPAPKAPPAKTTHPTSTRPVTKPQPVSSPHPTTTTHPVATPKPVATPHPAPKPAAPTPPVPAGGYTNPLVHASVTPERIDQGVDYSGSGTLGAVGAGTVTYIGMSGTGWPGAFIEYRLSGGSYAGRYVYYAEGVNPAGGLHVGETLQAGQPVAEIVPGSSTGIEIGWGSGLGTQTLAEQLGQWSGGDDADSVPSASGESFSALIASLGGPPGKVEG
jgi:hypothetical protein